MNDQNDGLTDFGASRRPDAEMDELAGEFGPVMDLLREGPSDIVPEQPSESIWAGIQAELAITDDVSTTTTTTDRVPPTHRSEPVVPPVISMADAREKRNWGKRSAILVAAAAAVLLVAVPLGLSFASGDGVELAADLDALDGFAGSGRAEVDGDNLVLDVEGLTAPDGSFYELWLLDLEGDDVEALRSIGRIADDGTYMIDPTIDLDEFSVVDISIEVDDGDDTHSGNSVLRGPLSS